MVLATGKHTENAAREIALRWRALAEELTAASAPAADVAALAGEVEDLELGASPEGLLLVAAGGRTLLRHELPEPPVRVAAYHGPLPRLAELVRQASRRLPHLVVVADRMGGTVECYGPFDEELASRGLSGTDLYVHKVKVGGWTHRGYQRRTEETWENNAALLATDVTALVTALHPSLVLVAGDVRARGLLRQHLAPSARELVRVVEHPGDDVPRAEVVDEYVREAARAEVRAVREQVAQELGRGGAAAAGLPDVRFALERAQVRTLVLDMAFVAEPADEGFDELLRAAVQTGAGLALSDEPTDYPDGVAALLRYADQVTP